MRKPKLFKKSLSVFLAFLMFLSSITVGFTAFAQNSSMWQFKDIAFLDSDESCQAYGWDPVDGHVSAALLRNLAKALDKDNEYLMSLPDLGKDGNQNFENGANTSQYPAVYTYKDGTVQLIDNDEGVLNKAADAFYQICKAKGFKQPGWSKEDTPAYVSWCLIEGSNFWKDAISSDWDEKFRYIVGRYLTGCGSANDSKSDKSRTLMINIPVKSQLSDSYPTIASLPDADAYTVANQVYWYTQSAPSSWGRKAYYTNNIDSAKENPLPGGANSGNASSDTMKMSSTLVSALKGFDNAVSQDALAILKEGYTSRSDKSAMQEAYSKLTDAQIRSIVSNATAAVS